MHDKQTELATLIATVNKAIAEDNAVRGPSRDSSTKPSVTLRQPIDDVERTTFGHGDTVPCWQGNQAHALPISYLKGMLQDLHETAVRRGERLDLDQLRQRALTVLTPSELSRLEHSTGKHHP